MENKGKKKVMAVNENCSVVKMVNWGSEVEGDREW